MSFSTFILDLQFFTCKIGCNVYILSRSLYLSWQTYVAFLAPKYESMHQMAPNYMSWPLEKKLGASWLLAFPPILSPGEALWSSGRTLALDAARPPAFNPRAGRRELLGVKTWLSTLETVNLS